MPFLTIQMSGLDTLQARLDALPARLRAALVTACQTAGDETVMQLSAAAPIGTGATAGHLAESFSATTVDAGVITTTVRTSQPQILTYVRRGTGIYGPSGQRIRPRNARALYWEGARHPVRSVAGQRPNDFVTPALAIARDRALARIQVAVSAAING
jgi:hypothetical protein